MNQLKQGDCREVLKTLEADSVDCVVTSPPYWGLRKYKLSDTVWDAVNGCKHEEWGSLTNRILNLQAGNPEFVRPWREGATSEVKLPALLQDQVWNGVDYGQ